MGSQEPFIELGDRAHHILLMYINNIHTGNHTHAHRILPVYVSDGMAGKSLSARPCICWATSLVAVLAGCTDDGARLSLEEGRKCATDGFEGRPGTFAQRGNTIAYSYESPNGLANVIVTFDGQRRPVGTFFASAPYGSHEELMDAAQAIKNCVAYGRKVQGSNISRGATSTVER